MMMTAPSQPPMGGSLSGSSLGIGSGPLDSGLSPYGSGSGSLPIGQQLNVGRGGITGRIGSATLRGTSYNRRQMARQEALESFLSTLRSRGTVDVDQPGFIDSMKEHFDMLPSKYAMNVNTSSLDVLNHKRLLDSARADPSAVSFQVRPVDVIGGGNMANRKSSFGSFGSQPHSYQHLRAMGEMGSYKSLPRPAFGSSPNLQALVMEADDRSGPAQQEPGLYNFYEVTIASIDQSKLLSRLSESLSDIGLNICEAHAFNTKDRFVLDVFVVNGWQDEGGTDALEDMLSSRLQELPPPGSDGSRGNFPREKLGYEEPELRIPVEEWETIKKNREAGVDDDWEIDPMDITFHEKIASGAFGDLFRGVYCGQDVAIKILRGVHNDSVQYQEFLQEVAIMRKVRHRNVVQFIGACTKKPHLCIVFEYMRGGSVYDHLRNVGTLDTDYIYRVALEVTRGMDYLHKRKIVHRDLKAANLLLDEHGTVKIADFGVARMMEGPGVMTAETGTYRWMAPEVIEHKPYGNKADVFSFGVVLWELLTGQVPYNDMTPLQAAVGVVQQGLRPPIPSNCPAPLADIMRLCWQRDPMVRPSFEMLKSKFEVLYENEKQKAKQQTDRNSMDTPTKDRQKGFLGRFRGNSAVKKPQSNV